MTDSECERVDALVPEVALGTAGAAERAQVLRHALGCERCRAALRQASEDADQLVLLVPAADPAPGFESRVLAAVGEPAAVPRLPTQPCRRSRALALRLAVAACLLLVGGLLVPALPFGHRLGGSPGQQRTETRQAAFLDPQGQQVGASLLVNGHRVFVSFTITEAPAQSYRVMLDTVDGRAIAAGTVHSVGGVCTWARMVDAHLVDVAALRLIPMRGGVTYTSRLAAT